MSSTPTRLAEVPMQEPQRTPQSRRHQNRTRWFAEVGWRHLVAIAAVFIALFPVLFIVSAALNPLGTVA